jgi:vacuolar-type H+-ATPase subunit H
MSGLETIKIIVDAEKEASRMLEEAQRKATEIRKQIDVTIENQRTEALGSAKQRASEITERAENEGKSEAEKFELESSGKLREVVTNASSKKESAVKKLVELVLS